MILEKASIFASSSPPPKHPSPLRIPPPTLPAPYLHLDAEDALPQLLVLNLRKPQLHGVVPVGDGDVVHGRPRPGADVNEVVPQAQEGQEDLVGLGHEGGPPGEVGVQLVDHARARENVEGRAAIDGDLGLGRTEGTREETTSLEWFPVMGFNKGEE